MLPRVAPAIGLAALLTASVSIGQVLPHTPLIDHLPNGLTVVTLPYDAPGIVAYYTLVRAGSRDETERGHTGFAHLFEHMMFRGTRQLSGAEYEHRMQSLGADNNAFTTEDYTLYTVTVPTPSLPALVPVEADRFEHLFYEVPEFQTETHAVLGEYNKDSANPVEAMWEALSGLAFTHHTYGHTTMGYLADIRAMPGYYPYSQNFFQRFYTPDDCTVIAAGDVQHDSVLALVRAQYGDWHGHRAEPRIPVETPQTAARSRALSWAGTSPPRILIGYRVPGFSLDTPDSAALDVVQALAFSESSDLYQHLVVRDQRLLRIESWTGNPHRDPGLLVVEVTLAPGTPFAEIETAITDELARIGRAELPRDRIADVVSHLRYALPMSVQTPAQAAELVARYLAVTGDPTAYDRYARTLALVSPEDVARVTRSFLTPARRSLVTLSPAEDAPPGAVHVGPGTVAPQGAP